MNVPHLWIVCLVLCSLNIYGSFVFWYARRMFLAGGDALSVCVVGMIACALNAFMFALIAIVTKPIL